MKTLAEVLAWQPPADGSAPLLDLTAEVPRLLATLQALGLPRDAVDWVIPSHVHLDHAGGVGSLMQHLPRAQVLVHPRGARHMVDPSALYQGALAVYGQAEMERAYGQLVPVAADRVRESADGLRVVVGGRWLECADTPGHARHHHCLWDERSRGWFTGDTFGLSYREHDSAAGAFVLPTSTPVQFDPQALRQSVARLLARSPRCAYLTHYGRVTDLPRLGALLLSQMDEMVELARSLRDAPQRHGALKAGLSAQCAERLRAHGVADVAAALAGLDLDLELNAQGLGVWLDRGSA